MKRGIAVLLLAAGMITPVQADVDKGAAAYRRGDYETALREFDASARQGDARAQFSLGLLYLRGLGVDQNTATAIEWLRKAADGGDGEARMVLADMYRRGESLPRDYVKSYMWLTLALARIRGPKRKVAYGLLADLATRMTEAEIAEAKKLANQWTRIGG